MPTVTVKAAGETVSVNYTIPPRYGCGSALPAYTGPAVITTPGTVISGKTVDMLLTVQAADVVIRNCLVRGAVATKVTGLIDARSAAVKRLLVQDCTFDAAVPSAWINGAVMGHDFIATGCDVSGVVDGFGIYNTTGPGGNATVADCWIHDLTYFAPDYATGNRANTHNDGIQVQSGCDVVIERNLIDCFMSTTKGQQTYDQRARGNGVLIQTNVASSPAVDYTVRGNVFHGGGNAAQLMLLSGPGLVVDNVFDLTGYSFGGGPPASRYQIRLTAALVPSITGLMDNHWLVPEGKLLTMGRDAGIRTD